MKSVFTINVYNSIRADFKKMLFFFGSLFIRLSSTKAEKNTFNLKKQFLESFRKEEEVTLEEQVNLNPCLVCMTWHKMTLYSSRITRHERAAIDSIPISQSSYYTKTTRNTIILLVHRSVLKFGIKISTRKSTISCLLSIPDQLDLANT